MCSLISVFVVHCLDSIIPLVSISEISSLYLPSVAPQAGLGLTWSKTPKTGFLMTRLICELDMPTAYQLEECQVVVNFLNILTHKKFVAITLKFKLDVALP